MNIERDPMSSGDDHGEREHGVDSGQSDTREWLTKTQAKDKRQDAEFRDEERRQAQASAESVKARAAQLDALQPSGDLQKDFQAYMTIVQNGNFNLSRITPEVAAAFRANDEQGLANFFREKSTSNPLKGSLDQDITLAHEAYNQASQRAAARILETRRAIESR